MIEKLDLIKVRDAKLEDKNFILSTILRGLYYGDSWFKDIPKDIFMHNYHSVVEKLLHNPTTVIKVACLKEDEDVILGYAIYRAVTDASVLDYVFVKSAWRKIGIAKSLVPTNVKVITHLTRIGRTIWKTKFKDVNFNPFLL